MNLTGYLKLGETFIGLWIIFKDRNELIVY